MPDSMPLTGLPPAVNRLTEATSQTMVRQIQTQAIATPLHPQPIATTYVQQGQGNPPIVLLHGFDGSVLEFRRLLPHLAPHHATWAIDLLGFGFTERRPGLQFSPAEIKQHLYTCWQRWIQQPMILVGASMGGAVAIDFALTYPDAVQQLVLIDSAGFAQGSQIPMVKPLAYLGAEILRQSWVRDRISLAAYDDPSFASADAALCAALHLNCPGWRRAMAAFTYSGGYTFLSDRIGDLSQPTLILWGRNDRILGTADAEKFAQALITPDKDCHSRLVWIEHSGHVPHLEQPERTAQHILSFIQDGVRQPQTVQAN